MRAIIAAPIVLIVTGLVGAQPPSFAQGLGTAGAPVQANRARYDPAERIVECLGGVRGTFKVPKFGVVAGCLVTEGAITRNSQLRLLRDNRVIYEGKIGSLRRFKDDVSEVQKGFECGIGLDKYQDVKVGDIIEAFQVEKVAGVMNA